MSMMEITLTDNAIQARFDYNPITVQRIRQVPGMRWHAGDIRAWRAPRDLDTLAALKLHFPYARFDPQIKLWEEGVLNQAAMNLDMKDGPAVIRTPHALWIDNEAGSRPWAHQVKAFNLMHANHTYALGAGVGTGKTRTCIELIAEHKRRTGSVKVLVVCPLSVCGGWKKQAARYSEDLRVEILVGDKGERMLALEKEADIYVINYAGLRTLGEISKRRVVSNLLATKKWDMVFLDESHNVKNHTADQSKHAVFIGQRAARRYILTGTLIANKPFDCYGQFFFMDPGILGQNYVAFQSRYAIMATKGKARFPVRFINLEDLSRRIAPWYFRVTSDECMDLPEETSEIRYAEFAPESRRIYKELARELVAELKGGEYVQAPIVLTKLLRFQQITAGFVRTASGVDMEVGQREKAKTLLEIIEQAERKVVVWCKFHKEIDIVRETLDNAGIGFVSLTGADSQQERQEAIENFQKDERVKVFVGNVLAGGEGVDGLQNVANVCVFMTNDHSLKTRIQAKGRVHRGGQQHKVTYIDVVVADTIDEKMLAALESKQDIADIINQDRSRAIKMLGAVAE